LSKSREKQTARPNVSHKTSFIDDVVKREKKMPGPKELSPKSKAEGIVNVTHRKTIWDDIQHESKKKNIPAAGSYDKVQIEQDRSRMKSDLGKADRSGYIDTMMRDSIEAPGVGNYNAYHCGDKRAARWVDEKNKRAAAKSVKLPPVGTY
jgi:hypothetical protein